MAFKLNSSRLQLIVVLVLISQAAGQLSKGISDDSQVDVENSKFLKREAHLDEERLGRPAADEYNDITCPQNLAVRWHTETSSSVVATPIITDLFSDGRKDIVVPGFAHSLEIVEGPDGAKDPTFQARHHSTMHTSPLLYDADFDGVLDIVAATYEGEVLFFRDNGEEAAYRMTVPRLRVRREWYVGLSEDPVGHDKLDVGEGDDTGEFVNDTPTTVARRKLLEVAEDAAAVGNEQHVEGEVTVEGKEQLTEEAADSFEELFGGGDYMPQEGDEGEEAEAVQKPVRRPRRVRGRHHHPRMRQHQAEQDVEEHVGQQQQQEGGEHAEGEQHKPTGQDEPNLDRELETLEIPDYGAAHHDADYDNEDEEEKDYGDYNVDGDYAGDEEADNEGEEGGGDNEEEEEEFGDYNMHMWDYDEGHEGDEKPKEVPKESKYVSPYAYVDAHFLATPVIADIDGDGREELIGAVTYFFDSADYTPNSPRAMWLGEGIDVTKYVASGIVVFDLHTRATKWSQHLDLSTAEGRYRADAYASPTLADINNDGKLEVIVGTSMGFLYVLDAVTGEALEGWPIQMGEIQGQVAVADINGDGLLELVVGDQRGSVAAFRPNGKEYWERHLGSSIAAAPTLGDVDGDGHLEVVVGSYDGRIHVLDGRTGMDVKPFPYRTYGHIVTPILLTKLDNERRAGLQLVVVAGDGIMYVVDGVTGCADTLDVGEPSRSMVLADDLAGSGRLDLLVTTTGGNLYSIRTAANYQPLKAWTSQTLGGASPLMARWNWEGVYTMVDSRMPRDVRGEFVPVRFKVVDRRPQVGGKKARYKVSATLQGVGIKEMNAGDRPVIGMSDNVNSTGTFVLEVPCPRTRTTATIRVEMRDEQGMVFWDEFTLSFHMHFYRLLKWMALAPFVFTAAAILAFHAVDQSVLLPA